MEKYIQQLVQDLLKVANTEPQASYIEPPPGFEDKLDIAELALTPYKSIEELTGIKMEEFPHLSRLKGGQWEAVTEAIFKVFDTFHIEPEDTLKDLPPEILYDVITTNWDYPVQFLPSTGFDLEFCTGEPSTCYFGEHCICNEDYNVPEEEDLPEINPDEFDELPF